MGAIFPKGAVSSTNARRGPHAPQDRAYRWEFLRRSGDYRHDYERFKASYGEWLQDKLDPAWPLKQGELRGEDPHNPKKGGFMATAIEAEQAFLTRWGILPTDPETRWSPFLSSGQVWVIDEGPAHSMSADPDVLTLCINTRGPLEEAMAALEARIRRMQAERERQEGSKKSRKPVSNFDRYLRAYDLKQQGRTDRKIANALGLTDEKAAKRYRDRARELIAKAVRGDW